MIHSGRDKRKTNREQKGFSSSNISEIAHVQGATAIDQVAISEESSG